MASQAPEPPVFNAEIIQELGPERERCEEELTVAGIPLPLPQRCAWARSRSATQSWFVAVRDATGACCGGFALEVNRSRALPGHLLLHAERFGSTLPGGTESVAIEALIGLAQADRHILRLSLQVFDPVPERRIALEQALAGLGFVPSPDPRGYTHTLALKLDRDEGEILASLHKMSRRNIKGIARVPAKVELVSDVAYASRLGVLQGESVARTGGALRGHDWPARIALSNQCPADFRLVGIFREDTSGPESLIAFAWGHCHGDYVHYDAAGGTRVTGFRVGFGHVLMWDLIRWAKQRGATWFDLGGITAGHLGDEGDRLGGISDFKRYFSKDVVEVGGEWVLEPHRTRARAARAVGAVAAFLGRARSRFLGQGSAKRP